MKWKTRISTSKEGERYIYGHSLDFLIRTRSFADVAFLLFTERFPSKKEQELFNAILVAVIEHGVEVPSAFVPRSVISTGASTSSALAAGLLSINAWHGGAIEDAAFMFYSKKSAATIVKEAKKEERRVPGYGHKIYKDRDPRAMLLFEKAKKGGMRRIFIRKALLIESELKKQAGKYLPINIDGAVAAILCELGIDARLGKAVFALGRIPGMAAHIYEEMRFEKPYRRFEESDVEYNGPVIQKKKKNS